MTMMSNSGRTSSAPKTFGEVMVFILVVAFLCGIVFLTQLPIDRYSAKDTRLAFGETRIAHIPAEFERRSPLFAASWEAFKLCTRTEGCDSTPIRALRDQAIKLAWPGIFDRLVVHDDWGEYQDSKIARDDFFAVLAEKGEDTLRNACLPRITFELVYGGERYYNFEGFDCT